MRHLLTAVCGCVLGACALLPWYRLNLTPSVPVGLYRLHAVPAEIRRGDLVLFMTPESVHDIWPWWRSLLKPVAGVAGDTVCVQEVSKHWPHKHFMVRSPVSDPTQVQWSFYGPVYPEAEGKALPQMGGCTPLREGEIVVASRAEKSMDSRYFGTLPITAIRAIATPVLTWGK